jgi:hypothetical protein
MFKLCVLFDTTQDSCRNSNLRLMTKARGYKVVGQERDPEVTSHASGSAKNVKE